MTVTDWLALVGAMILVFVAGLFVAADAALARVSKARAGELLDDDRHGAAALVAITQDPARYINVLLLLRLLFQTAAVVIVAVVSTRQFHPDWLAGLLAVLVMVVVEYVAVGVGPRTFGRAHAIRLSLAAAPVARVLASALAPLTSLLILVGNALTPGPGTREGPFATEAELRELVDRAQEHSVIADDERQMIHSVFELSDTIVREVMVPRTEMIWIESTKTLRQGLSLGLRSGFSRIPVIGTSLDDVIGVVYLKDLTRRTFEHNESGTTERVGDIMRKALFVPDSKPVDGLLRDMQTARVHIAIVVDEYGGTAGLVTIEDVLEQIVGDISDEYDVDTPDVQHLADGSIRVTARLNIDDLNELCGLRLEDDDLDDVDTAAGLLAKRLGKVPIPGASVEVHGWTITAEAAEGRRNRIRTLLLTPGPAVVRHQKASVEESERADA